MASSSSTSATSSTEAEPTWEVTTDELRWAFYRQRQSALASGEASETTKRKRHEENEKATDLLFKQAEEARETYDREVDARRATAYGTTDTEGFERLKELTTALDPTGVRLMSIRERRRVQGEVLRIRHALQLHDSQHMLGIAEGNRQQRVWRDSTIPHISDAEMKATRRAYDTRVDEERQRVVDGVTTNLQWLSGALTNHSMIDSREMSAADRHGANVEAGYGREVMRTAKKQSGCTNHTAPTLVNKQGEVVAFTSGGRIMPTSPTERRQNWETDVARLQNDYLQAKDIVTRVYSLLYLEEKLMQHESMDDAAMSATDRAGTMTRIRRIQRESEFISKRIGEEAQHLPLAIWTAADRSHSRVVQSEKGARMLQCPLAAYGERVRQARAEVATAATNESLFRLAATLGEHTEIDGTGSGLRGHSATEVEAIRNEISDLWGRIAEMEAAGPTTEVATATEAGGLDEE